MIITIMAKIVVFMVHLRIIMKIFMEYTIIIHIEIISEAVMNYHLHNL